jgi:hypothetical protein
MKDHGVKYKDSNKVDTGLHVEKSKAHVKKDEIDDGDTRYVLSHDVRRLK